MSQASTKLRLAALIALVVGSMIGGGIFSLPQNMAASASAGAILIGWAITAVGMLALAFVFQSLANRKPELDAGVYAYAKAGFGDYMGYGLVAEGKVEIYAELDLKPWDLAACKLLVEEAGGRFTDLDGRATIYSGTALATNGRLHDAVLALLRR